MQNCFLVSLDTGAPVALKGLQSFQPKNAKVENLQTCHVLATLEKILLMLNINDMAMSIVQHVDCSDSVTVAERTLPSRVP